MRDRFWLLRFDGAGGSQVDLWFTRKKDAEYHMRRHARNGDGVNFRLMLFEIPKLTGLKHSSPRAIATYILRMLGGPSQQARAFVRVEAVDAGNEDAQAAQDGSLQYREEEENEPEDHFDAECPD